MIDAINRWWQEVSRTRGLMATFVVSAAMFAIATVVMLTQAPTWLFPPYSVTDATVVTPQVMPGEPLRVGFRIIRRRLCQIDLDRFIARDEDDVVVWRKRVPGGVTPIGSEWTVIEIRIPNLDPGRYEYYTTITNTCEGNVVYVTQTPRVSFTILPPGQQ